MTEQNKLTHLSQEDVLRVLEQIKVDVNKLKMKIEQIKAENEVKDFFKIPEIPSY